MTDGPGDKPGSGPRAIAAPRVHFRAERGWVNDPHGVVHAAGRYRLFYQANPNAPEWAPAICWGYATSPDLFGWTQHGPVLRPEPGETGCFTGCVVDVPGTPTILYTSVRGSGLELDFGRIVRAVADPGWQRWRRTPAEPVLACPQAVDGDVVRAFRDPMVTGRPGAWTMVVGAGLARCGGAVLAYQSPDLARWESVGVLLDAAGVAEDFPDSGVPWSAVWECPQLLVVDGSLVLLVSIWDDGRLTCVAAGVGNLDRGSFVPRSWQRFSLDSFTYASSVFVDAEGRPGLISWLRELPAGSSPPPVAPERAGALSVPYLLHVDGDRLHARIHPGLAGHLGPSRPVPPAGATLDGPYLHAAAARRPALGSVSPGSAVPETESPRAEAGRAERVWGMVVEQEGRAVVELTVGGRSGDLTLRTPGGGPEVVATLADSPAERADPQRVDGLELLLDGDLVEVTAPGLFGVIAARATTTEGPVRIRLLGDADPLLVASPVLALNTINPRASSDS